MEVTNGGKDTPLRLVMLCKMKVLPSEALHMNGGLYLSIDYLQSDEWKDLEFKSHGWLVNVRN